jgi:hypothetical protein
LIVLIHELSRLFLSVGLMEFNWGANNPAANRDNITVERKQRRNFEMLSSLWWAEVAARHGRSAELISSGAVVAQLSDLGLGWRNTYLLGVKHQREQQRAIVAPPPHGSLVASRQQFQKWKTEHYLSFVLWYPSHVCFDVNRLNVLLMLILMKIFDQVNCGEHECLNSSLCDECKLKPAI